MPKRIIQMRQPWLWLRWTDEADAEGLTFFYGLQRRAVREVFIAGEVFFRIRPRRSEDGLTVPLQLQLLPSEMLPKHLNQILANGHVIRQGIEFDAIGRRVAYHFYRRHPGDSTDMYQGVQRQNAAFLDRFTLCEMGYPDGAIEQNLLRRRFPTLPEDLCDKMVEYANEVRRLFMGEATDTLANTIEITFSTRSLLRWADLTKRFQPLARQGIQPIAYALDRALAYRASRETRAMLHELIERMFPKVNAPTASYQKSEQILSGQEALDWLEQAISQKPTLPFKVSLSQTHTLADGTSSTKIWEAEADVDTLTLQWGRKGTCPKMKVYPATDCQAQTPLWDLKQRVIAKINEGYSLHVKP